MKNLLLCAAAVLALLAPPVVAAVFTKGTSYEAQIKGFMLGTVSTFVRGEFAGRGALNKRLDPTRAACTPDDFEKLLASRGSDEAFEKFDSSCRIITFAEDWRYVHGTVRLPQGYCETIKAAYDHVLATQVLSYSDKPTNVIISYRGAYFNGDGDLARGASLKTSCRDDGSFYIRAERKRR